MGDSSHRVQGQQQHLYQLQHLQLHQWQQQHLGPQQSHEPQQPHGQILETYPHNTDHVHTMHCTRQHILSGGQRFAIKQIMLITTVLYTVRYTV